MGIITLTDTMKAKALAMLLNSYLKEMAEGFSMQVDLKRVDKFRVIESLLRTIPQNQGHINIADVAVSSDKTKANKNRDQHSIKLNALSR